MKKKCVALLTVAATLSVTSTSFAALAGANTVNSAAIIDGQVATADLANGAVTAAKIATGTITGSLLATGTITGTQLAAGAVTAAKIATGTITGAQLAAGAVADANVSDVSMGKVTGLQAALSDVYVGLDNPIVPTNTSEPFVCDQPNKGAVSLTALSTLCACNGKSWVSTADGRTSCQWIPPNTVVSAGQVWMDRNVGASQVATSVTDTAAYGGLYQWGRTADVRSSATTSVLSSTPDPGHNLFIIGAEGVNNRNWLDHDDFSLWQGVSGTNNVCPAGFRVPTQTELQTEYNSWGTKNSAGGFASPLKLTAGGYRYYSGASWGNGATGDYWSSTIGSNLYGTQDMGMLTMYAVGGGTYSDYAYRTMAFSVRCIMD